MLYDTTPAPATEVPYLVIPNSDSNHSTTTDRDLKSVIPYFVTKAPTMADNVELHYDLTASKNSTADNSLPEGN
jgi:hypothetical protein